jgi:hypothetical protein
MERHAVVAARARHTVVPCIRDIHIAGSGGSGAGALLGVRRQRQGNELIVRQLELIHLLRCVGQVAAEAAFLVREE